MKISAIARRYAKALVENCGDSSENKAISEEMYSDLKAIRIILSSNRELLLILKSLVVPSKTKLDLVVTLTDSLQQKSLWKGFFVLVMQKHRAEIIPAIIDEIEILLLENLNTVKLSLTLAREHKEEIIDEITKHYELMFKKRVVVDVIIKPEILGGYIATANSYVFDASVRNSLDRFQKRTEIMR